MAREAVQQVAAMPGDVEIDPASQLFFEFAAPLLMEARTEQEFLSASAIAEFVWATTHFDSATQVAAISQFIETSGIQEDQVSWFLDVYAELAARKAALLGE